MFYLIKIANVSIYESELSYNEVREIWGTALCGCFGRRDYAEIWRDFRNGNIDREQLNKLLWQ